MKLRYKFLKYVTYFCALLTISILVLIIFYIFFNGLPSISLSFVFSKHSGSSGCTGILPMIINTFYIMIITLLITVPTGVFAAVYMTQYARKRRFVQLMRSTTDVLAGIPSVIFGLFGYAVFCSGLKLGVSIISGCLTMMICTLPTIIRTAEESLSNVPRMFFDAAAALGTGKVKIIFEIIIPAAIPGILTSVILCAEKILGESAALIYTTGMSAKMPSNFFSHALRSGRTLTLHLYQTAKQANTEDALSQAFATASVLLIIIFILNLSAEFFLKRIKKQRHLS